MIVVSLYTSWPHPWHLRGPGEVKLQGSSYASTSGRQVDDLKKQQIKERAITWHFSLLDWSDFRRKHQNFDL